MGARGYIYAEIEVINPLEYERWRVEGLEAIAAHGGRFLVRRGDPTLLVGNGEPRLVMILEFDSRTQAAQWFDAMKQFHSQRARGAEVRVVLLSGVEGVA